MTNRRLLPLCAAAALAVACREPDSALTESARPAAPTPPTVTDGEGPYTLRYFAPLSGDLLPVRKPADVPDGARGQVIVVPDDLALQGPWLFVADLTQKQGDRYIIQTVDRYELEQQRAAAQPKTAPPAADHANAQPPSVPSPSPPAPGMPQPPVRAGKSDTDVVLFKTPWCGYCKKAAQYLKLKGVQFVERDLESDPGARADLAARAQRAGFPTERLQGVPILSIKGRIVTGFDRGAIDRALAGT
jgi:glutaredoxin